VNFGNAPYEGCGRRIPDGVLRQVRNKGESAPAIGHSDIVLQVSTFEYGNPECTSATGLTTIFQGRRKKARGYMRCGTSETGYPKYLAGLPESGKGQGYPRGVEVTPAPAPSVREAHIGALAESIVGSDVSLFVVKKLRCFSKASNPVLPVGVDYLIEKK